MRERFRGGTAPRETCACAARARGACTALGVGATASGPLRLETPRPGDRFLVDPAAPPSTRFVVFRASAPEGARLDWFLDGAPLGWTSAPHALAAPLGAAGGHEIAVRLGGEECRARFEVR